MDHIDIQVWNKKIESAFIEAKEKLPQYEEELKIITTALTQSLNTEERLSLDKRNRELIQLIDDIRHDVSFGYYTIDIQEFLEKFEDIIDVKESVSFMKGCKKQKYSEYNKEFVDLIHKYNNILKLDIPIFDETVKVVISCSCGNKKDFEIVDNKIYYCLKCGEQIKEKLNDKASYKDSERVNNVSKYKYTRQIHYRNCLRQYQGKQKIRIIPQCIKDITDQLQINGITERINPQHIRTALQETGWADQYENFVLLWSVITKKPCPDITDIEEELLEEFDIIEKEYNKLNSDNERSSFMSYPYVLYQCLMKRGVKCNIKFFNMLKSDRLTWLDDMMSQIFKNLGWHGFVRLS